MYLYHVYLYHIYLYLCNAVLCTSSQPKLKSLCATQESPRKQVTTRHGGWWDSCGICYLGCFLVSVKVKRVLTKSTH